MADKHARTIRMQKEHAAIRPYVAKADDGTVLGFTAIEPKPAAIVWRIGQTTFMRFDSNDQAKLFMEKFGNSEYRLSANIQEAKNV